ncbi:MAG: sigma-70 family RNA polymerase sigma factor [Actinocatenispora sp.]
MSPRQTLERYANGGVTGLDVHRTDAELVAGDFAALFDRHAVVVHRYFARRIGTAAADDLLAQTFLIAYERRDGYDRSRPDARPWLFGIAANLLRRRQRDEVRQYRAWARTGVDPVSADHAARVADQVDASAAAGRLAGALAALSHPDREVLLLVAWDQLSYSEVAAVLDIPVGTVRSRLHRARIALRAALPHRQGA